MMNFLIDRKLLRELLKQGDVMNTVNGGIRDTSFKIKNIANGIIIEVSNPSISPEAFNFTVNRDELLVNVMYFSQAADINQTLMYPMFFRVVKIPYNVDINKIEATYDNGVFRVYMPFNNSLPDDPFKVRIKNLDH